MSCLKSQSNSIMEDTHSEASFLKEFTIPTYILEPESKTVEVHDFPTCPVLVFINSRSGGQLGGDLIVTYRELLNKNQVIVIVSVTLMFLPLRD